MTKVLVSGCYDILHAGHIQFFKDARALGDHLTVCFASDVTIYTLKGREPAMPEEHRRIVLESLRMVDQVVMGRDVKRKLDCWTDFLLWAEALDPDILATTEDDPMAGVKVGYARKLIVLPKTLVEPPISTTEIRERICR